MPIINCKKFQQNIYKSIIDDKTYWLEGITHANEVCEIYNKIPTDVVDQIINGNIYLLISNEFECFLDVPEAVYKHIVIEHKIPESKILFLSGAKNISELCKKIVADINEKYNTNFQGFETKFFPWYENFFSNTLINRTTFEFKRNLALEGRINYKKHFLLFNRRWRLHRPVLIALLKTKNLLDHGYVSLGSNDQGYNWNGIFPEMLEYNKGNADIYNILEQNKKDIISIENLVIDTDDFENKTVEVSQSVLPYYETSFCSIVTETYFYGSNTYFLTEKTFKPIAHKHPFILAGTANSLGLLHDMGYKTFHTIWDESYDTETCDSTRMYKLWNLIQDICKMSQKDLQEMSRACKYICNYNYKKLLSSNS